MAKFRLHTTAAILAAAGLGLAGASWAQGTPPAVAPPDTSITSPDTAPSTSNGTAGSNSGTQQGGTRASGGNSGGAMNTDRGGAAGTTPRSDTRAAPAAGETKPAHADTGFMDQAAQNGHAEIEAARLALQKGQSDAVKTFAQHMIDDHTAAAQELQALATSKNHKLPEGPSLLQKGKLKMLGTHDGAKFDRSYIESMGVQADQRTIELFEKGASKAKDGDVKAYAEKTLPTLRKHLEMAQQLDRDVNGKDRKNATHDAPQHNSSSNNNKK